MGEADVGEVFVGGNLGQSVMGLGHIYGEHVDVVAELGVLIVALAGEAFETDAVAAQDAQQQGDGVAGGGEGANPAAEVGHALLEW